MARTKEEIFAAIKAKVTGNPVLSANLTSTSEVSDWQLWCFIMSECIGDLEELFDLHRSDVVALIAEEKPHTLQWYVGKAIAYQHGDSLPDGSDIYATVRDADDAARVVKFAAGVEASTEVRIKVAKGAVGSREALSGAELTGFTAYMKRVKDAGVRIRCTSGDPDNLQLKVNVYYDPLVLAGDGSRLDGSATTPVKDAVNNFLATLPFNGVMAYNALVAAGQAVEGVKVFEPTVCRANYGATPYVNIMSALPNTYVPDAGYLELDDTYFDAEVTYVPMP